jgi:hypothetical protein
MSVLDERPSSRRPCGAWLLSLFAMWAAVAPL